MPGASQIATHAAPRAQELSLEETLRVMDVAREIRDRRETVEDAFRLEDKRRELREKLMRSARLSGDNVSEVEIDAAIDQYYKRLHTYSDPERGWQSFVAHCWVWRMRIMLSAGAAVTALGSWWFFFS